MNSKAHMLIDEFTGALQPCRPLKRRTGRGIVIGATSIAILIVAMWFGLKAGLSAGVLSPTYILTNGLLLLLGFAASFAVVNMAMPRVGSDHDSPKWAMAGVALLPLAAIGTSLTGGAGASSAIMHASDFYCFARGSLFATITAAALLYWLRRGAPVSPDKAGLFLGVAAGAMGSFAYGISCPIVSVWHLGVWHVMPVLVWGLIGRIAVPHLVQW